jgi:site-specific DNA recombinase
VFRSSTSQPCSSYDFGLAALAPTSFKVEADRQQSQAARTAAETKLARVNRSITNLISAIKDGFYQPSMKSELHALEAEKAALTASLAEQPPVSPVSLHPKIADVYRAKVQALTASLNRPDTRAEAASIVRGLIDKVILTPTPQGHTIELYGELGAILELCEQQFKKSGKDARLPGPTGRQLTVVAGAGFEPTTFRL